MSHPTWSPDLYQQFRKAREQPARDLQAMLPAQPYQRVVDLGCGSGEGTLRLAQRFSQARVLGLDASAEMLRRAPVAPNLHFEQRNILDLEGHYDLIYSNAALQWLPDHPALLARLWAHLLPGGALAVQVPANHKHPSHRLISETAREFATELRGLKQFGPIYGHSPALTPAEYAETLDSLGAGEMSVLARVYPVTLRGAEGVLDWVRGTALRPYLSHLSAADAQRFTQRYLEKLREAFPEKRAFYAFTRILFVALRPEQ